jgi:thioredoxin 1
VTDAPILVLNDDNFDDRLSLLEGTILVDFWAGWCAPCKKLDPVLLEIAAEFEGEVHVAKVDVEENGNLANRFSIRSIPTLIVFQRGKVLDQLIGAAPKTQIVRMLERHC